MRDTSFSLAIGGRALLRSSHVKLKACAGLFAVVTGLILIVNACSGSSAPSSRSSGAAKGKGSAGGDGAAPPAECTPYNAAQLSLTKAEKLDGSKLLAQSIVAKADAEDGNRLIDLTVKPDENSLPASVRDMYQSIYAEFEICDAKNCIGGEKEKEKSQMPQWRINVPIPPELDTTLFISARICAEKGMRVDPKVDCGPWYQQREPVSVPKVDFPALASLNEEIRGNEVARAAVIDGLKLPAAKFILAADKVKERAKGAGLVETPKDPSQPGPSGLSAQDETILAMARNTIEAGSVLRGAAASEMMDDILEEKKAEEEASQTGSSGSGAGAVAALALVDGNICVNTNIDTSSTTTAGDSNGGSGTTPTQSNTKTEAPRPPHDPYGGSGTNTNTYTDTDGSNSTTVDGGSSGDGSHVESEGTETSTDSDDGGMSAGERGGWWAGGIAAAVIGVGLLWSSWKGYRADKLEFRDNLREEIKTSKADAERFFTTEQEIRLNYLNNEVAEGRSPVGQEASEHEVLKKKKISADTELSHAKTKQEKLDKKAGPGGKSKWLAGGKAIAGVALIVFAAIAIGWVNNKFGTGLAFDDLTVARNDYLNAMAAAQSTLDNLKKEHNDKVLKRFDLGIQYNVDKAINETKNNTGVDTTPDEGAYQE